jgi:hypothetical protein
VRNVEYVVPWLVKFNVFDGNVAILVDVPCYPVVIVHRISAAFA